MWSTNILVILATASLVYSAAPRSLNTDKRCSCNGLVDSRGEGQCRSSIGGRAFCYVDPGTCSDQVVSSTEGRWETVNKGFGQERQWSFHWRSHIACEEEITELSTTDDLSGINFPQRETVRRPTTITTTTTFSTSTTPPKPEAQLCWCQPIPNYVTEVHIFEGSGFEENINLFERGSLESQHKSNINIFARSGFGNHKKSGQPQFGSGEEVFCQKRENEVVTTPRPIVEKPARDWAKGNLYCWCEPDLEAFFARSSFRNRNIPLNCLPGEKMECREALHCNGVLCEVALNGVDNDGRGPRKEPRNGLDNGRQPPQQEPRCSCNGQLNNQDLQIKACGSQWYGNHWCYVDSGRCPDEIVSSKTGRAWSKAACKEYDNIWV